MQLSILIPCHATEAAFDQTLASVLRYRPDDCEIVVAVGSQYADPYDLGREVRFVTVDGQNWFELVDAAMVQCRGAVIHLLASGTEVTEGWTDEPVNMLADRTLASVSPILADYEDESQVLSCGLKVSSKRQAIGEGLTYRRAAAARVDGPSWMAGFYRRDALLRIWPDVPPLSPQSWDADVAARLNAHGGSCGVAPSSVVLVDEDTTPELSTYQTVYEARLLQLLAAGGNASAVGDLLSLVADLTRPSLFGAVRKAKSDAQRDAKQFARPVVQTAIAEAA